MANETVPDFKTYPVIGRYSYEQTRFLRYDPEPYKPFEHEVKAQRRKEAIKDISESLLAFGLLGLLIYWGLGL